MPGVVSTMPPGVVPYIVPLRVLQGSGAIRARRVWGSWGEGDNGLYLFSIRDRDGMRVVFIVQYVSGSGSGLWCTPSTATAEFALRDPLLSFSIRDRGGMRVVFIVQYVSLEKVRIL